MVKIQMKGIIEFNKFFKVMLGLSETTPQQESAYVILIVLCIFFAVLLIGFLIAILLGARKD